MKNHEGMAIYERLLPSLFIKPFKNSLALLRRGLNLETHPKAINKSEEVLHEGGQAGGRIGRS